MVTTRRLIPHLSFLPKTVYLEGESGILSLVLHVSEVSESSSDRWVHVHAQ